MQTGEHLPAPSIEDRVAVCKKTPANHNEWKGLRWASLECTGIIPIINRDAGYQRLPAETGYPETVEEIDAVLDEIAVKYAGYSFENTYRTDPITTKMPGGITGSFGNIDAPAILMCFVILRYKRLSSKKFGASIWGIGLYCYRSPAHTRTFYPD